MKKRNIGLLLLTLVLLVSLLNNILIFGQNEISITLNDKVIYFPDTKPYMDIQAGRVLVPVRFVAESLGALVEWDPIGKQVDILKDKINLKFKIGEKRYNLNDRTKPMDTAAFIEGDRTLVPLRVVSENLNMDLDWDEETYTVHLRDKSNKEFIIQGVYLGQSEEELVSKLGKPNRKDLSEYEFDWYIYNEDYSNYIQVGVKDNEVVGIYTNADNWKSKKGISIGMTRADIEKLLGKPLEGIRKGNTTYLISDKSERGVYYVEGSYVSIFYDLHNRNTVTGLQIIDENMELSLDGFYGEYSEELRDSFERQVFDLTNSIRVRNKLKPLVWSDKAQISSRKHSQDMALNNFFDHTNLRRESPFDRMKKEGIRYTAAAENIAAGTASAIQAHEGWMNSQGHRVNILGDFKSLGVGVSYNSNSRYKYYFTQNFYTGR